jgi:hypothetical protein
MILANSEARHLLEDPNNMPGLMVSKRFFKPIKGAIHCECLLALHLLRQSRDGIHSVRHLGVSKLSCLACWQFLKSLCDNGIFFSTTGSHGKAYFPWKFPNKELEQTALSKNQTTGITASFSANLSEIYVHRLLEQEKARTLSDSSAGSASETGRVLRVSMEDFEL